MPLLRLEPRRPRRVPREQLLTPVQLA